MYSRMSTREPAGLAAWRQKYDRVRPICERLGRTPRLSDGVPATLVNWLSGQRRATSLSNEQKRALQALPGWSWEPRQAAWMERADDLRAFIATHGRMPRERDPDESALAHWYSRQRVALREGRLSAERRAALEYAVRHLGGMT